MIPADHQRYRLGIVISSTTMTLAYYRQRLWSALIIVLPINSVRKCSDEFSKYVLQKDEFSNCAFQWVPVFFRTSFHRTEIWSKILFNWQTNIQWLYQHGQIELFDHVGRICCGPTSDIIPDWKQQHLMAFGWNGSIRWWHCWILVDKLLLRLYKPKCQSVSSNAAVVA